MKHKLWRKLPSQESGFTIIESLVALMVAGILLAAVAPVIVLSVATRVQAKRVETATDAARNYIDGVRSGVIAAPNSPITNSTSIAAYSPPTVGSLTCTANAYCTAPATNLYCVSIDGNTCTTTNTNNFVIQAIRLNQATVTSGGSTTNITDPTKGYMLGVRVYRSDGFAAGNNLKKYCKQPTFAAGLGDRKAPLIEMTTEISRNVTFNDLNTRLSVPVPDSGTIPKCS